MATLTVRNLDDEIVKRLRVRAAENGRSAEAEHREILKLVLVSDQAELERRRAIAAEMREFHRQTAGRGGPSSVELIRDARIERLARLSGTTDEELSELM
jgi:plasmid stability protein